MEPVQKPSFAFEALTLPCDVRLKLDLKCITHRGVVERGTIPADDRTPSLAPSGAPTLRFPSPPGLHLAASTAPHLRPVVCAFDKIVYQPSQAGDRRCTVLLNVNGADMQS
ncbi:Hypothetical protein SMAX5B_011208 [Scophthalmus maximus]|uniref:Uncharacterized protein n=1 Tax=Scophthalmus maximus TaxID=52904 RepID=A0A2U9CXW8_SCOMX|nr:Hypothetical protein SMAX5B_011208 [Scophthalmus maximus]